MKKLVDTSVAIKWAVEEEGSEAAFVLYGPDVAILDVLLPELANTLWKKARRGEIAKEQALAAYAQIMADFKIISTRGLEQRALELSLSLDHPSYDCFFLAAAEAAETILITADARFVGTCSNTPFARYLELLS